MFDMHVHIWMDHHSAIKENCKFKFKKRGKITVRHTFFGVVQIEY